jgi:hypothetical protein
VRNEVGGDTEGNNIKLRYGFMRNVTIYWLPTQRSIREALGSIQGTEIDILTKNFRGSSTVCPDDCYKSALYYGHVFLQ